MSATDTSTTASEQQDDYGRMVALVLAWLYIITGAINFVANALMLVPIVYHRAFRNRLVLADCMSGLAYVCAGIYRQVLMNVGAEFGLTGFGCGLLPFNILWGYFFTQCGVMLAMISVDRLMVTVATMWYISKGPGLAYVLVGIAYAHGFAFGITQSVHSFLFMHDTPAPSDLCYQAYVMSDELYDYEIMMYTYGHFGAVAVYMVTWVLYVRHNRKTAGDSELNVGVARAQKEMTVKMAWSTLATFCLISRLLIAHTTIPLTFINLLYVPTNLNPMINAYIFLVRTPIMRKGLLKALRRQHGPVDLKHWTEKTTTTVTAVKTRAM